MGGLALLAKDQGHDVSGSDADVYPPMSTQLEQCGITLYDGYGIEPLRNRPDTVIIGNTLSRGNECVEYVLNENLSYSSGPQWLAENILAGRHVLAVSGTHGKTTGTAMLSWVLEKAGLAPGFLIGGVAENFARSARTGGSRYFVVEADEYDTAFFDKRSKFIHYRPRTLIINNIEFDHADIFDDINDIIREFRRLVRIIPQTGRIIYKQGEAAIEQVFAAGCWTPAGSFGMDTGDWQAQPLAADFSRFRVLHRGSEAAVVEWGLIGRHNAENALAVLAAARHVGVTAAEAAAALASFRNVRRRMQCLAEINGIYIYDDFAHHPSAIEATLSALRAKVGQQRIIALFEPRSNTMKLGTHRPVLGRSFAQADSVFAFSPAGLDWDLQACLQPCGRPCRVFTDTGQIIESLADTLEAGDHVLIMSNGGFEGIQSRLIDRLRGRADSTG